MNNNSKNQKKKLLLKGKTLVIIDWANVYGWTQSLKREPDPLKIFEYLKTYKEIEDMRFYFGTDVHEKSIAFIEEMSKKGFTVITKPVKYVPAAKVKGKIIYRRKCDFDMEACIDVHALLKQDYQSFIFFTGDGDYDPLYKMLIQLQKQVIVVYAAGHLGREIWGIKKGLFKAQLKNLIDI
ncbi:MAG: NYN domain-containing protein [Candidatus Colwellbacteria bacterium]|nr:NYN domain-containing protein [Candidatus Colwellbacteria bacterium]